MSPKLDVPYENPAYDKIFGSLRGTPYYGKCPDLQEVWVRYNDKIRLLYKTEGQ